MQREVVRILKKYLDIADKNYQDELDHISTFSKLLTDWELEEPPPEDALIRRLARELITTIRGVNEADLIIIPERDRAIRFIRDILPYGIFTSKAEEMSFAEDGADFLLRWLKEIHVRSFWRGERISEAATEGAGEAGNARQKEPKG